MPSFAASRLTWEPRVLSILRIMVGLLYMEHGTAKILDFPHLPTHAPYALFTLVPGLQGLLECWLAVYCSRSVCSLVPSPLSSLAIWRWPISWPMRREGSFRCSTAASWQSSTASSSSIYGSLAVANGASIDCGLPHPHPPYRRAGPKQSSATSCPSLTLGLLDITRESKVACQCLLGRRTTAMGRTR
jgi:hypothetical protein